MARTDRKAKEPGRSGGEAYANTREECISPRGPGRKSDPPIVAVTRVTTGEPRGGTVGMPLTKKGVPLDA